MAKTQRSAKKSTSTAGNRYPSVRALADDLGLCERTVRTALRRNEIPHVRVGRRFVLPKAAIRRWLEEAGGHFQVIA